MHVKMYICGVTVYDESHIGHARTYVAFDVIRRYLMHKGYRVTYIQNFTDVDDKIINRARELSVPPQDLAKKYIDKYFKDFDRLNVLRADLYPCATEHIKEMQQIISVLLEKGFAYITQTGVYYSVSKFKDYGRLSHMSIPELKAGARVEIDETKKDPLDFALWKFASDDPNWDSPWKKGRPGWHTECSAMSMKYLGDTIDIHGGGQDLIFPHHENEIAQSEAYTGKLFVKIWMHTGFLMVEGEKMSKSLGNIIPLSEALDKFGANVLHLFYTSSHYRSQVNHTQSAITNAAENLWHIENAFAELQSATATDISILNEAKNTARKAIEEFEAAMDKDFNTPEALKVFMGLVKYINRAASMGKLSAESAKPLYDVFIKMSWIFGLKLPEVSAEEKAEIEKLIEERNKLRAEKKFREADEIRSKLREEGIELTDYTNRTVWRKTTHLKN